MITFIAFLFFAFVPGCWFGYWRGRLHKFTRHMEEVQRAVDDAYRAGLERARNERALMYFKNGFDFAMRLVAMRRQKRAFELGAVIVSADSLKHQSPFSLAGPEAMEVKP